MAQPTWVGLTDLGEQHAADKGLYDLIYAAKMPVAPEESAGWFNETLVWQSEGVGEETETARRLFVDSEDPEAVKEQLSRLGY